MEMFLTRGPSLQGATIGDLRVGDAWQCFTLEDVVREVDGVPVGAWKHPNITAIPRGRYRVIITHSLHFGRDLPLLVNVPGYTAVRIHPGNKAADTEGCILVGQSKECNIIDHSKAAFDALFPKIQAALQDGGGCFITVA